jgi:hypothetical protein
MNHTTFWYRSLALFLMLLFIPYFTARFVQGDDHLCRVYTMPDGTVQIVHPAPQAQLNGESNTAFYARIMNQAVQLNPKLAGQPYVDVMTSTLPTDRSTRYKWRIQAGKVIVDTTVPDATKSIDQQRKDACAAAQLDLTAATWLKTFCATF